jgi:hypothetical protein
MKNKIFPARKILITFYYQIAKFQMTLVNDVIEIGGHFEKKRMTKENKSARFNCRCRIIIGAAKCNYLDPE